MARELVKTIVDNRENYIINGSLDFWQRGTSLGPSGPARFLADRWLTFAAAATTVEPSRQSFIDGQTEVPNQPKYFHRTVVNSAPSAGSAAVLEHRLEDVRTLAEKTATLSFWAKADSTKQIAVEFVQNFGIGGSAPVVALGVRKVTLTNTWQKFEFTVTFPSVLGKTIASEGSHIRILIFFEAGSDLNDRTDNLGNQSGTFDIAQIMLNVGSTAAPFKRAGGTVAGELALCQRYYEKWDAPSNDLIFTTAKAVSSNEAHFGFRYLVRKRVAPTIFLSNTTVSNATGGRAFPDSISVTNIADFGAEISVFRNGYFLSGNAVTVDIRGFAEFDAEL